jgi:hypothetical protein
LGGGLKCFVRPLLHRACKCRHPHRRKPTTPALEVVLEAAALNR